MPTNLIELSNCCISLQRPFRFSAVDGDDNGKPTYYNSVYYFNDKQFLSIASLLIYKILKE